MAPAHAGTMLQEDITYVYIACTPNWEFCSLPLFKFRDRVLRVPHQVFKRSLPASQAVPVAFSGDPIRHSSDPCQG